MLDEKLISTLEWKARLQISMRLQPLRRSLAELTVETIQKQCNLPRVSQQSELLANLNRGSQGQESLQLVNLMSLLKYKSQICLKEESLRKSRKQLRRVRHLNLGSGSKRSLFHQRASTSEFSLRCIKKTISSILRLKVSKRNQLSTITMLASHL